jgi:hypothetical protein
LSAAEVAQERTRYDRNFEGCLVDYYLAPEDIRRAGLTAPPLPSSLLANPVEYHRQMQHSVASGEGTKMVSDYRKQRYVEELARLFVCGVWVKGWRECVQMDAAARGGVM